MTVNKITTPPSQKGVIDKINEVIDNLGGGGTATDVQINGTSITSSNVANIITESAYNASSNKIATMSDVTNHHDNTKQDTLVSGTNIKTINGQSLLGSGNIQTPYRNIGEIVESPIPQTDAGLHLLDGSLIQGGGIYDDFVTYIAGLVTDYPDLFETEANWQTSVSTYGVCGKFVYNSVNNTVRLPKYSNKIYTKDITSTASVSISSNGQGVNFTDGTNTNGLAMYSALACYTSDGVNKAISDYVSGSSTLDGNKAIGFGSQTGLIGSTDLSNITTPLDGYYYIVIATSTKTNIEVDIDNIATDLNGKADVDLSNINASQNAKNTIVNWGIPDYNNGIDISAVTYPYTAPCDGYITIEWYTSNYNGVALRADGNLVDYQRNAYNGDLNMFVKGFVSKGSSITLDGNNSTQGTLSHFYPLKGVN